MSRMSDTLQNMEVLPTAVMATFWSSLCSAIRFQRHRVIAEGFLVVSSLRPHSFTAIVLSLFIYSLLHAPLSIHTSYMLLCTISAVNATLFGIC